MRIPIWTMIARINIKMIWVGIFLVLACFAFTLSFFRIDDADTFQYLASGKLLLSHGFSHQCFFSYVTNTCQIVYSEWLFSLVVYFVHLVGGWNGLVTFQVLLVMTLLVSIFLHAAFLRHNPLLTGFMTLFALLIAKDRFMLRADLMGLTLAVVFFVILDIVLRNHLPTARQRWLNPFFLGGIYLFWVNSHGSFPLAILIVLCFFVDRLSLRFLTTLLIVVLAASFINPYGLAAAVWPLSFMSTTAMYTHAQEWQATFFPTHFEHLSAGLLELFTFVTPVLLLLRRRFLSLSHFLILAMTLYLSVSSFHNIAYFPVFVSLIVPGLWPAPSPKKALIFVPILFGVVIFYGSQFVSNSFYLNELTPRVFGSGLSKVTTPMRALEFIRSYNLDKNIFNDYGSGAYVNWYLYPDYQSFIDGHTYTVQSFRDYQSIMNKTVAFPSVAKKFNVKTVFLSHTNMDTIDLITALYKDPEWTLVFFDENSVIFIRSQDLDKFHLSRVVFSRGLSFAQRPYEAALNRTNRGVFFIKLDLLPEADYELEQAILLSGGNNFSALTMRALVQIELGNYQFAHILLSRSLTIKPNFAATHYYLGRVYWQTGQLVKAEEELQKALAIDPTLSEARQVLSQINPSIR